MTDITREEKILDTNDIFLFKLTVPKNYRNKKLNYVLMNKAISFPMYFIGFQHFLHQTKRNFNKNVSEKLQNRKQVYEVINPIYHIIDDYENDINTLSKKFFNTTEEYTLQFYVFWEMFVTFAKKINFDDNMLMMCVNEGSCIFAANNYREMYSSEKDKYIYSFTNISDFNEKDELLLYDEKSQSVDKDIVKKSKIKIMSENHHKTCDIMSESFYSSFVKFIDNGKFNCIVANGVEFGKSNHVQESSSTILYIKEIYIALAHINKGGSFILRTLETFTKPLIKILYLITHSFSEAYVYKPFMSKKNSAERFMVFVDYIGIDDEIFNFIKELSYQTGYIDDIITEWKLEDETEYINDIKYSVITIGNNTYKALNQMIAFVEADNYKGDVYYNHRKIQIHNSDLWSHVFLKSNNDIWNKYMKNISESHKKLSYS